MNLLKLVLVVSLLLAACGSGPETDPLDVQEDTPMTDPRVWPLTDQPMKAPTRKGVNVVAPVEPRQGPWTGNSSLGQGQAFAPDTNNRQSIIKTGEWGRPQVRTVSLALQYDRLAASNSGVNFNVVASVLCGVGGTTHEFEVDWDNGAEFSVPCNSVQITAIYGSPFGGPFVPPSDLRLSAMVGEGRSWCTPPTRTYSSLPTANGAYSTFPDPLGGAPKNYLVIPPYAKLLKVLPLNVIAPNYGAVFAAANRLEFYASPAVPGDCGIWPGSQLAFQEGIPIPNGARIIRFFNGSGNTINAFFQFVLAL